MGKRGSTGHCVKQRILGPTWTEPFEAGLSKVGTFILVGPPFKRTYSFALCCIPGLTAVNCVFPFQRRRGWPASSAVASREHSMGERSGSTMEQETLNKLMDKGIKLSLNPYF